MSFVCARCLLGSSRMQGFFFLFFFLLFFPMILFRRFGTDLSSIIKTLHFYFPLPPNHEESFVSRIFFNININSFILRLTIWEACFSSILKEWISILLPCVNRGMCL